MKTIPNLSTNLPKIKFPNANPTIVNENKTDTSPRLKLNSFCISGRTITIAHIPILRDVPIRNVIISLNQEYWLSCEKFLNKL